MARSVGVVVPAYDPDVESLRSYVGEIRERLGPDALRVELDDPSEAVREAVRDLPVVVSVSERRRGKGAAITAGFEALDTDVLAFADADGSTPAASLQEIVETVRSEEVPLAVGSRRHPESRIVSHQTYARRWLGHGFARLARTLLDVDLYDYQCGAKAIDRDAWESIRAHLYESGFAWDLELVAMADAVGYSIKEVPIEWRDQPGSTVSPIRDSIDLARALLVIRHRARLIRESPLHVAIDTYREERPALIDRESHD